MEVDLHKLKVNDPFLGQYQHWCVMSSFPTSGRPSMTGSPRLSPAMR